MEDRIQMDDVCKKLWQPISLVKVQKFKLSDILMSLQAAMLEDTHHVSEI
jgi:hypothetical protein